MLVGSKRGWGPLIPKAFQKLPSNLKRSMTGAGPENISLCHTLLQEINLSLSETQVRTSISQIFLFGFSKPSIHCWMLSILCSLFLPFFFLFPWLVYNTESSWSKGFFFEKKQIYQVLSGIWSGSSCCIVAAEASSFNPTTAGHNLQSLQRAEKAPFLPKRFDPHLGRIYSFRPALMWWGNQVLYLEWTSVRNSETAPTSSWQKSSRQAAPLGLHAGPQESLHTLLMADLPQNFFVLQWSQNPIVIL